MYGPGLGPAITLEDHGGGTSKLRLHVGFRGQANELAYVRLPVEWVQHEDSRPGASLAAPLANEPDAIQAFRMA